jgi:hypothetical protein
MLDAAPLGFREPAEEVHDKVVRFAVRIDGTADLGHPQFHVGVTKDWEDELELLPPTSSIRPWRQWRRIRWMASTLVCAVATASPYSSWRTLPVQHGGATAQSAGVVVSPDPGFRSLGDSHGPELPPALAPGGLSETSWERNDCSRRQHECRLNRDDRPTGGR